ncbi:WYL domain-containing protein [Paenibacillus alvei]|uniref:helix-turn-helix transcriptional regulator n=1 Tax=Paenibacillus alvei TaxID=44250 RepID=UPI0030B97515
MNLLRKIDRLTAIIIALQQRPETAQSLAEKFEVSRRTIIRDMQALGEMGVPLYATSGSTGGYRLMEGYTLQPLQLTTTEALTVLFALQGMTQLPDSPFNQERWTVMDKLKQIVSIEVLTEVEPILERIELSVPARNYRAPQLKQLLEHIAQPKPVWLHVYYRSQKHERWLYLQPNRIYSAHGFWYCDAYSPTHGEDRAFRVDRMSQIAVVDDEVFRELEGQSISNKQTISDGEKDTGSIRVRAKLTYRGMLLAEQDEHIGEYVHDTGEDMGEVDFSCPRSEWEWAQRFFYGLGLDAEVLEPDELRTAIHQHASQVSERYARTI